MLFKGDEAELSASTAPLPFLLELERKSGATFHAAA